MILLMVEEYLWVCWVKECGACDQRRSLSHSLISIEAVEVGCLFCPYGLMPIWALTVPPTKHSSSFPPDRYIFNLGPARPPWYKEYMRSWRQHFTGIFRAVKRGGRLPLSMASNCPCLKVCPASCNKGFAPSSAHKRLPLVLHRQASWDGKAFSLLTAMAVNGYLPYGIHILSVQSN